MNAVLSFLKNKWTKFGFSILSVGYGLFLIWLAWLSFSYYLIPTNPVSLFSLYLLINVLFGALMIYTRKQIITRIVACVLHPCILATLVFAFGDWFLLVPPFVIATVVFFAAGSSESIKTILGTVYLILFVLTTIAYLTLQIFNISILTVFDVNVNLDLRSDEYLYSPKGTYRLVMYVDPPTKENRTVTYYIESATEDLNLPFLKCEMFYGGYNILTQRYDNRPQVKWLDDSKLYIDGKVKDVTIRTIEVEEEEEDDYSGETAILTTPPPVTKASATEPVENQLDTE